MPKARLVYCAVPLTGLCCSTAESEAIWVPGEVVMALFQPGNVGIQVDPKLHAVILLFVCFPEHLPDATTIGPACAVKVAHSLHCACC